jgi:hypothetical protein
MAGEHSAWGKSGRRVVVFLGDGVDRVEFVVDDGIAAIDGLRIRG